MGRFNDEHAEFTGDVSTNGLRWHNFTFEVDFSDLGSGGSDLIAFDTWPTGVYTDGICWVEPVTAGSGEADLAVVVGDTADPNGCLESVSLNALSANTGGLGALHGLHYEADWATAGLGATFTATELDDVTAGRWRFHMRYATLHPVV